MDAEAKGEGTRRMSFHPRCLPALHDVLFRRALLTEAVALGQIVVDGRRTIWPTAGDESDLLRMTPINREDD